jgi:Tol biopolymer transport system component
MAASEKTPGLSGTPVYFSKALFAGMAALLVLVFAGGWALHRHHASAPPIVPESKLHQLTTNSFENRVTSGAISADGKYLAYSDMKGIYVKLIETGEIHAVPPTEEFKGRIVDWDCAFWFPDSPRFVANATLSGADTGRGDSHESSIWIASVLGESPRKLRDNAFAYSLSPDGSLISFTTNKGMRGDREILLMGPSGDQTRKLFDAGEGSSVTRLHWSPDGKRILYIKTDESGDTLLSRDLASGPPTTIFGPNEMKLVTDLFWAKDGRLFYSVAENGSILSSTCDLWETRLDARTGSPVDKPAQLASWPGFCLSSMTETSDGKKFAFLKSEEKTTLFVGELTEAGSRIVRPRHFPVSESSEAIVDWAPDSRSVFFVSDRSDHFGIYKQSLDQDFAEQILSDGYNRNARLTPDAKSIVYLGIGEKGPWPARGPEPVMRVSVNGGPAEYLYTARPYSLVSCARSPSHLCVIGEPIEDGKQLAVSVLDPEKGRGPELFRFALVANDDSWYIALSPDGTRVAASRTLTGPIHILSAAGHELQQVRVKDWSNVEAFNWASDGKGLFVTTAIRNGKDILHVDLHGNAHLLWENSGASGETVACPSPDGRHLAFNSWTTSGNMWIMENF